ncbi:endonuclease/exonuclease/phosphatase family protein, partial [Telluribacter humicola]
TTTTGWLSLLRNGWLNFTGIYIIANVLVENRQSEPFVQQVRQLNPELVLVMEVDQWWVDQLKVLKTSYPYVVEYPLDNAYGMALYSKLPLEEPNVAFLDDEQIPSIHTKVIMPATRNFMFHGVHPVAPVPSDKYPDGKGEKEVSLLKVGDMVAKERRPSVVAGDFNDVSWSRTSRLFGDRGRLYNIRLGRGLFNSFDANSYIERWPLDHIFVTRDFTVVELQRLPYIYSDHFPIYVRLALQQ